MPRLPRIVLDPEGSREPFGRNVAASLGGIALGVGVIASIILAWYELVAAVLAEYVEPAHLSGPHVALWVVLLAVLLGLIAAGIVADLIRRVRVVKP